MTESATRGADPASTGGDTPKPRGRGRQKGLLDGKPAHNRHFMIDVDVLNAAERRAAERNIPLSQVVRAGLDEYIDGTPEEAKRTEPGQWVILPQEAIEVLRDLWATGDRDHQNGYLKALREAGWTYQAIASGMVAGGIVQEISRQAIYERSNVKAPEEIPDDLPPAPQNPAARAKDYSTANTFDYSLRLADEQYGAACRRADYEGSFISAVVESIFRRYANGEFVYEPPSVATEDTPADI